MQIDKTSGCKIQFLILQGVNFKQSQTLEVYFGIYPILVILKVSGILVIFGVSNLYFGHFQRIQVYFHNLIMLKAFALDNVKGVEGGKCFTFF